MTRWDVTKAVRASDLPSASRLIMLTLADVAEVGTAEIPARFTPSLTVLARETGLGRSTVKTHLSALEDAGWIVRTRPDAKAQWFGERTRYRLTRPESMDGLGVGQEMAQAGQEMAQGEPVDGLGVGQELALPGPGDGHLETDHSDQGQISSDLFSSATPPKASKTTKRVADDDPDFAAFWAIYPRREAKGAARKAWDRAIKRAATAVILAGAERYRDQPGRDPRYTAHPATWLNADRWSDEHQPTLAGNGYRPFTNPTDEDAYGGTL